MKRIAWLLILSFALHGCGADNDDSSSTAQEDDEDWEDFDSPEEELETGSLVINLPGEHGSGEAMCSLYITRAVEKRLATVMLEIDVIGKGCDGMGNCDDPNMQGGELTYNGGIEGEQAFATMILNYEPPSNTEEQILWMYNVIFNAAPFSRFEMLVDGKSFNVLTSDVRGAEDYSKGPHLWNTKLDIEADMLQSIDADDQASPGLQTRGKFSYEGLCEVSAKYIQL